MRAPPPLACTGALMGAWRVALCGLLATVAGALCAWGLALAEVAPSPALIPLAIALGAGAVAWFALPTRRHHLRWTGAKWALGAPDAGWARPGRVTLALDLGAWMLVRFDARAGARGRRLSAVWLPLAAGRDPAGWPALRAALWTWREPRR